jgi:hypothetical protein
MSRLVEWIRDDLRKVNRPGEIVVTVRTFPVILLKFGLHLAVGLLVIYAALALFGNSDVFGSWWWLAVLWSSSRAGAMIHRQKTDVDR